MKLAVIALTGRGQELAVSLKDKLRRSQQDRVDIYLPRESNSSLKELTASLFAEYEGLIFIMALGIVVRVLAPYLSDKREDPAVVTIAEDGSYIISTLSGHLGGANSLTERLAELLGGDPVITTASDCQGLPALDLLARELNCEIIPFNNLKLASGALVNGEPVNIFSDYQLEIEPRENLRLLSLQRLGEVPGFPVIISERKFRLEGEYLQLVPRSIVLGLGCRRGVSSSQIEDAVELALKKLRLHRQSIKHLATISLKRDENGLLEYAARTGLPLEFISREEIRQAEISYTESKFVREKLGIGGVSEPAAMLTARKGELILSKTVRNQVTVAAVREKSLSRE